MSYSAHRIAKAFSFMYKHNKPALIFLKESDIKFEDCKHPIYTKNQMLQPESRDGSDLLNSLDS